MPRVVTSTNNDQIVFTSAKNLLDQIASKGVPVSRLSERIMEGPEAIYLDVTDPTWGDDGQPHNFYASVWGTFQDVASIARTMSGAGSWFSKFVKLATGSFETDNAAVTQSLALAAIDSLPGVAGPMETFLKLDWKIDATAPNQDGTTGPGGPIHPING